MPTPYYYQDLILALLYCGLVVLSLVMVVWSANRYLRTCPRVCEFMNRYGGDLGFAFLLFCIVADSLLTAFYN